jgi:HAD superfamily hydrolase (TIGR01509 family)
VPLVVFISKLAKQHGFEVSAREFVELNARAEPLILDYFASRLRPVESVRNVLEELRRNNCTIGIVSTSSHQWIDVCLRASELKDLVRTDLIFSASSESVPAKPDPTIYRMALSALPRDASVVAVEDSPSGIKSAVAAGVPTVVGCVAFGILGTRAQQATTLRQLGASAVFDDWNAFFPAVTRAMHAPVVQSVQFLPERMTANLTLK